MIQKQVEYEISKLNQLTSHINKELKSLPSETIHEERNGPYYRYYLRQNGQKHYLHKKDHEYILALASRKYLTNELASLQMQLSFLSDYLLTITNDLPTNTISNPKLLANLTKTSTYNLNDSALAWQNASYESNPRHPEQLTQRTDFGLTVRSKSEAQIATALHNYAIPFRYEAALELNEVTIYPDFTILHPFTGKIVYWEHFGRMDDPRYRDDFLWKMRTYPNNGIMPSRDLIMTFEYPQKPLDAVSIEQIIKDYFIECTL